MMGTRSVAAGLREVLKYSPAHDILAGVNIYRAYCLANVGYAVHFWQYLATSGANTDILSLRRLCDAVGLLYLANDSEELDS